VSRNDVPETRAHPATSWLAATVVWLRWPILAAWAAGAVALTLLLPSFSSAEGAGRPPIPDDAPAQRAERASAAQFGAPLLSRVLVVQRAQDGLSPGTVASSFALAARVSRGREPGFDEVAAAVPLLDVPELGAGRERATTIVTGLYFRPDVSFPLAATLGDRYAERLGPSSSVAGVTGSIPSLRQEDLTVQRWLPYVTAATLAVIALVLGIALRSVVAPLVALLVVGVAYLVDVRVIRVVEDSLGTHTPSEAEPVVLALLFAVVTDYAAFFMYRTRRLLADGVAPVLAARRAATSIIPVVVAAGLTVAAGTATVFLSRLDFFRAFGPALAITGVVAAGVSVTLVPALLAVLGRRAFWPSDVATEPEPRRRAERGGYVHRLLARPVPAACVSVLLVGGLAAVAVVGLRDARLGFAGPSGLPSTSGESRAADAAAAGFAPGIVAPTEIVVAAPGIGARRSQLASLQAAVLREPGVADVLGPGTPGTSRLPDGVVVAPDGSAARMLVVLRHDPFGPSAVSDLGRLMDRMPALLAASGLAGARVSAAGDTALAGDTIRLIERDLGRVGIACCLVVLVLLVLYLRSVIAPLLVLAATALGYAATLGLTALVAGPWLGAEAIVYFVPLAASVLLISLGSDYSVFLVGRVWERAHDRPIRTALGPAVSQASRAITIAGLVLALSFAVLAMVPLVSLRQFAFTMAAGVVLDAFVVRSLLLPALLGLAGERSRWPLRPRAARPAQDRAP
jgi:putative drug exporter of the RND superfamily